MENNINKNNAIPHFDWQDLSSEGAYSAWKNAKNKIFEDMNAALPITVDSLNSAGSDSIRRIKNQCQLVNFSVFQVADLPASPEGAAKDLQSFAANFGLSIREDHRSAGEDGVVALKTTSAKKQRGYIPYTPRALNWHTDGYYNDADNRVEAFALYCHATAQEGGENQLLDPEVAYLRMRDENPDYVRAFMHPRAMTIPANTEDNGQERPASIGPVFYANKAAGRLQMRYTARTRSIEWRDDGATLEAAAWMREWLGAGDALMVQRRLKAGEGVLNNNVLHNRTSFVDDPANGNQRIMMRARFHDRISED